MSNKNNRELNPEDFWPEAEKMLDRHYAAKRRRRRMLFFSFFIVGALAVLSLWKDAGILNHSSQHPEITVPSPEAAAAHNSEVQQPAADNAGTGSVLHMKSAPMPNASSALSENEKSSEEIPVVAVKKENKPAPPAVPPTAVMLHAAVTGKATSSTGVLKQRLVSAEKQEEPIVSTNTLLLLQNLPALGIPGIRPDSIADYYTPRKKELLTGHSARWDLLFYAGLGMVQKELSGNGNAVTIDRRQKEEKPTWLPNAGMQVSKSCKNWDIRGGLEFAVMGEQVKYSPYKKGTYYNSYNEWEPYSYTISDTDSVYIFGNLYLNTRLETVNDSLYVTKTDTLNGLHYDPSLQANNGINRWYILEVPMEVVYQFRRGRWGAGVSAGIAPGVVIQSSGRYLRDDESGVARFQQENTGKLTLNARAGVEFSYLLQSNIRILLRPSGRYFLTKMDAGNNTRQRYSTAGISAGILYLIP